MSTGTFIGLILLAMPRAIALVVTTLAAWALLAWALLGGSPA